MRRRIGICICAVAVLFCVLAPALAGAQKRNAPVGGNLLPDGFYITPTAAPGSIFQGLPTGLRPDGSADADGAVTTALSPDGTALLVLTTGYNTGFYTQGADGTAILWPALYPLTGLPSSTLTPNAEWVFVFDVRGAQPVQKQLINIPNTYHGLIWDPSGATFYVAGGIDDRIEVYTSTTGGASADGTYTPSAPFVLLNHDQPANVPIQQYPTGGLFNGTPVNNSPVAQTMFIPFAAVAAGLAISPDGTTLYVANYQNDSLSVINTSTRLVTNEIVFFAPGQTTAVGEMPYWPVVVSNSQGAPVKTYVSSQRDGQVLDVSAAGSVHVIKVGGEPNRMILSADQHWLFVSNGDLDEIEVIDTAKDVVTSRISIARPGYKFKGSNPNSLALSPDGTQLYVTLGGENAVAVVNVASQQVLGRIPTGWYPSSVTVSADGKTLYVVNMKSNAGPNLEFRADCPGLGIPPQFSQLLCPPPDPTSRNEYILALLKAGLSTIPVPDANTLTYLSSVVDDNNGFNHPQHDPMMAFLHQRIKHVIYIQKENRTYDQILGDLPQGNGDPTRVQFPQPISPNHHLLATQFALLDNYYDAGDVSGDGWNWDTQGHANDATTKNVLVGYGNANYNIPFDWNGNPRNIGIALPDTTSGTPSPSTVRITTLFDPTGGSSIEPGTKDITASEGADDLNPDALGGYIWDSVLRAGLTVRHYGLYADENYYVDPAAGAPFYIPIVRDAFQQKVVQAVPVRKSLIGKTDLYYRGWDLNTPDQYRFEEWNREFTDYVKKGNLPSFEMVDFMEDHFGNFSTNVATLENPLAEFASNDYAVGRLVEAVTNSPYWKDTAIFVVEDDAQNGPDHVDAHRSTVFVISPYTLSGGVIHTMYNSTNVLRTIEDILGVSPLGLNDANAVPMSDVFIKQANLQPYTAPIPGILCEPPVDPTLVPECKNPGKRPITAVVKPLHDGAWWAAATKGFNFKHPDLNNADQFNRILWKGIMGDDKPYPGAGTLLGRQEVSEADRD
ncbi:MAG: bifunctional YncE family protein/alkaline phosphatase family protein [Terriglobales bacterium]|jgi:YVTN family beta-propeller protein